MVILKEHCLLRDSLPKRLPALWSSWMWEKQLHVSIVSSLLWARAVLDEGAWMSLAVGCALCVVPVRKHLHC